MSDAVSVHSVAGDGVLARRGELVLLCDAGDGSEASARLVDELLEAHRMVADEGGDGTALADAVTRVAAGTAMSVVAFAPAAGSLVVTVFGRGWAIVATEYGEQRLTPRSTPPDGLRSTVPGDVLTIRAGVGAVDDTAAVQRWSDLAAGVTRAGGLVVTAVDDLPDDLVPTSAPAAAAPAPTPAPRPAPDLVKPPPAAAPPPTAAPPPSPAASDPTPLPPSRAAESVPPPAAATAEAQPSDAGDAAGAGSGPPELPSVAAPGVSIDRTEPFSAVVLVGGAAPPPEAAREPLPVATRPAEPEAPDVPVQAHVPDDDNAVVIGVYCKNGHFDDPAARYCAICGISMAQQTLIPRPGPRPPLGVLVLDDGSIFSLDADYVIGRDPSRDADVVSGAARPLRIDDPEGLLSRVHARIHLDGWDVEVVDLGSANGTGIWGPRDSAWTRAPERSPVVVRPGTQIGIGRRQMRYESHRNT